MKLELKHLAPYLPYKLNSTCLFRDENTCHRLYSEIHPNNVMNFVDGDTSYTPMLKSLSDLTDTEWFEVFKAGRPDIEHRSYDIERHANAVEIVLAGFNMSYCIEDKQFGSDIFRFNQQAAFEKMCELHGDQFGLIDNGLALNKLNYRKQ